MMTIKAMDATEANDAELVAASLGGSRDAFRRIVERYQTLICSLASATGNVSQSQDMAQETFLAAWKDLAGLREPEKLKAWLCRIARNRIYKSHRRAGSDLVIQAMPLEEGQEVPAVQALPSEQAISREEEAILWLVAVAWRMADHLTAGLVILLAGGMAAWKFFDPRRHTVRATFGHVGLCCALIVSVINLRLDVWLATNRGVSVAAIHQIYPLWLVPLFSVAAGLWIGLLLRWPVRKV